MDDQDALLKQAVKVMKPFAFSASPEKFQSDDGGCTEALIADEDVQRVRAFLAKLEARHVRDDTHAALVRERDALREALEWYAALPKEWTVNAGGLTYGDLHLLGERARAALSTPDERTVK